LKNNKITISVITVCKNAEKYIEETIQSVVNQKNKNISFNLEYFIFDGNSSDNTNKIISKYSEKYPEIHHFIEDDNGLYDGLVKGFLKVKGEIVSYINAGDFYYKNAFSSALNFFNKNIEINWITGAKVIYNEESEIVRYIVPFKYRRKLIEKGVYGKNLPFIQQESTFWKKKLLDLVNFEYLKTLKKSGDMYLWHCFSKKYDLFTVDTYFSGFKFHENQLTFRETGNTDPYLQEASKFLEKKSFFDYFYILIDGFFWLLSKYNSNILNRFNKNNLIYNIERKEWVLRSRISEKYVGWACEINKNQGEGKLATNFISYLSNNKHISIYIKTLKNKIQFSKGKIVYSQKELISEKNNLNFFEKYINPFIGVLYLWYNYLMGKRVIYVNFLPLWNFLIFLTLPPKTILGPITGTTKINSSNKLENFLRKFIMPFSFKISCALINFRKRNILLATESLKEIVNDKVQNKKYYNFSLDELLKEKNFISIPYDKRKYDFCIYFRNHPNKNINFLERFIREFSELFPEKKMVVFGDKPDLLKSNNVELLGMVDNSKVLTYLNNSKFSIVSDETLFSFFMLDSIRNNVNIFFNNRDYILDKNLSKFVSQLHPINFGNFEESIIEIRKRILDTSNLPNYDIYDVKNFYSDYFQNF
jgi:glycosyltransferase involved in cell wall biosynthesis